MDMYVYDDRYLQDRWKYLHLVYSYICHIHYVNNSKYVIPGDKVDLTLDIDTLQMNINISRNATKWQNAFVLKFQLSNSCM